MRKLHYLLLSLLLIVTLMCFFRINSTIKTATNEEPHYSVPIQTEKELARDIVIPAEPKYSDYEKQLIARVVHKEAKGESDKGQQAIVQLILNRKNSKAYGGSIEQVIKRKGQFCIADTFTAEEMANVEYVIENGFDMPADVMYFGTWQFRDNYWRIIGGHYFMR